MSANIWDPGSGSIVIDAQQTNTLQAFAALANQTIFDLTLFSYTPDAGSIAVYRNGQRLEKDLDYQETSGTRVTLLITDLIAGDRITVYGIIGSAGDNALAAAASAAAAAASEAAAAVSAASAAAASESGIVYAIALG
jgi:hypothetical protein